MTTYMQWCGNCVVLKVLRIDERQFTELCNLRIREMVTLSYSATDVAWSPLEGVVYCRLISPFAFTVFYTVRAAPRKTWSANINTTTTIIIIFRSTSKSRPNNIRGGKCPSVRTSVRPSTKSFLDFNEIWYVGRGRWVMHDGMPYGLIQGQGQGHEPLKVWIPSIFKTYLPRHLQWELANDH